MMCTLIVLHRSIPGSPLVVAANRDEFLGRPAEGFSLRSSRTGPIVAPRDLEAGGTWVGLSGRGVFAGLTNLRPSEASGDLASGVRAGLISRGQVVMTALESESAKHAVDALSNLEEGAYNPFQLLVADGHDAWLMVYRDRPKLTRLEPGLHVVGNVEEERFAEGAEGVGARGGAGEEEPRYRKLTRIREHVEKLMTEPGRDHFDGLARICREHVEEPRESGREGPSPFESTCVHVADRYGTRSSLLLELSLDPDASRLWTTDGPPCEWSFENRSSLLRELGVRLSARTETETMRGKTVEKNW
jgi:uncharacterized protein with NRDE domain